MRVFVPGLPHTLTSPEFCSCAFTMKVWNLCRMLTDLGWEVVHFGNEGSRPQCSENVPVMPFSRWSAVYSHPGTAYYDIAVDTPEKKAFHADFAASLYSEMERRLASDGAIVCVTWGGPQRTAAERLRASAIVVESGIGYLHSWARFRVFESYAWLHMTMGKEGLFSGEKWYWPVIPNAFDPEMFEFRKNKGGYFLYLGRLNADKGLGLAVDLAQRTGRKLVVAGQGDPSSWRGECVEYAGAAGVEQRRELLAGASALLCPTYYVEPFGGVAVEAQMSGTPVITTDYGAFPETVLHGVTGFRCRTMEQFEYAARNIASLDPSNCRAWAMNFSLKRVAGMYAEYFRMLDDLRRNGFYEPRPNRTELEWLHVRFPTLQSRFLSDV